MMPRAFAIVGLNAAAGGTIETVSAADGWNDCDVLQGGCKVETLRHVPNAPMHMNVMEAASNDS